MAKTFYAGFYSPISVDEVLTVRRRLSESNLGSLDFGGPDPIDNNKLASAVERQNTGFDGREKYNRPHEKAATLFYGLSMNHPFENGNKRTALVSCLVALERNYYDLCNTSEDDLYQMATAVTAHEFPIKKRAERTDDSEVEALAKWFRGRIHRQNYGDHGLSFKELQRILTVHGCEFDPPSNNFIKIRRGSKSIKIGYPRAQFDVPVSEVKKIRRQLDLDVWGSSREFYDFNNAVDKFVDEYRYLLWRLADA